MKRPALRVFFIAVQLLLLAISTPVEAHDTYSAGTTSLVIAKYDVSLDTSSPVDQTYTIRRIVKNVSNRTVDSAVVGIALFQHFRLAKISKWIGGPVKPGGTERMVVVVPIVPMDQAYLIAYLRGTQAGRRVAGFDDTRLLTRVTPQMMTVDPPTLAQRIQAMIDRGEDLNQIIDKQNGETALTEAVMEGDVAAVKLLISHDADVNAEDSSGHSALEYAQNLASDGIVSAQKQSQIELALQGAGALTGDGNQGIFSSDGKLYARVTSFTPPDGDSPVAVIRGTLINDTGKSLSYVEVDANFDNGGAVVDSGMANAQNIAPGDIWNFKVTSLDADAEFYKLTKVTYSSN